MKKISFRRSVALFAVFLLLAGLIPAAAPAYAGSAPPDWRDKVYLADDFSDGLGQWEGYATSAAVYHDGASMLEVKGSGSRISSKKSDFSDFYMNFKVDPGTSNYMGAQLRFNPSTRRHYMVQAESTKLAIYTYSDSYVQQAYAYPAAMAAADWKDRIHDVGIDFQGNTITVYLDGAQALQYTDATATSASGRICFREFAFGAEPAYYGNLVVADSADTVGKYYGAVGAEPLIVEDFDAGLYRWAVPADGSFAVASPRENNRLLYSGDADATGGAFALAGNAEWGDYLFSARLTPVGDGIPQMAFRYLDDGSHYLIRADRGAGRIAVLERLGGGEYAEIGAFSHDFAKESVDLSLIAEGAALKVSVDGSEKLALSNLQILNGKAGFKGSDGMFYADNAIIAATRYLVGGVLPGEHFPEDGEVEATPGEPGEPFDISFPFPDFAAAEPLSLDTRERFEERVAELPSEMELVEPVAVKGGAVLYVSNGGSDGNPGTEAYPLRTLGRALGAIKSGDVGTSEGAVIYLRGGTYGIDSTIALDGIKLDGAPLVISSYPGEKAVLAAGDSLDASLFHAVSDEGVKSRLPARATGKVVELDLDADVDIAALKDLYLGAFKLTQARYPNVGLATIASVIDGGPEVGFDEPDDGRGFTFTVVDDRPGTWLNTGEIRMFGSFSREWWNEDVSVDSISGRTIHALPWARWGCQVGLKFYFYNIIEELDVPGEYVIDSANRKLYLYPLEDQIPDIVSARAIDLIKVSDCENIVLDNLELSGGAMGVALYGSEKILLQHLTLSNQTSNPVYMDEADYNVKCGFIYCDIYNAGAPAIVRGGERATLTPGYCFGQNNYIFNAMDAGFGVAGVANVGSHNLVSNIRKKETSSLGISYGGNENVIEYNEVVASSRATLDIGGIYSYYTYGGQGNHIRYNYIHHIESLDNTSTTQPNGVYNDEYDSGQLIYGNVIYDIPTAFLINASRDNAVVNNIAIAGPRHRNGRFGYIYTPHLTLDNVSTANYNLWAHEREFDTMPRLAWTPNSSPLWQARYPNLKLWVDELAAEDPNDPLDPARLPKNNYFGGNLIYNYAKTGAALIDIYRGEEYNTFVEGNYDTQADPGFADAASMDFSLRDDAAVFDAIPGFLAGDFGRMGLYPKREIALPKAIILQPASGAANVSVPPAGLQLNWSPVQSANGYEVAVATDPAFENVVASYTADYESANFTGAENGTTYYWKATPYAVAKSVGAVVEEPTVGSFSTPSIKAIALCYVDMVLDSVAGGADSELKTALISMAPQAKLDLAAGDFESYEAFKGAYSAYIASMADDWNVVYAEDYEGYEIGNASFDGYTLRNVAALVSSVDGSKVFDITDAAQNTYGVWIVNHDPMSGSFSYRLRIKPMANATQIHLKFRSQLGDPAILQFDVDNKMYFGSDGGNSGGFTRELDLGSYSAGQWYDIELSGSTSALAATLKVNGETLVENFRFPSKYTVETRMTSLVCTIGTETTYAYITDQFYFDDLRFEYAAVDMLTEADVVVPEGFVEPEAPPVDKSALEAAITGAEALLEGEAEYTADSFAIFVAALESARLALADAGATQAQANAAKAALEAAIAGLEGAGEPGDGEAEALAQAKTALLSLLRNTDGVICAGLFTEDSATAYEAALDAAKVALAEPEAKSGDVKTAREALLTTVRGLEVRDEYGEYGALAALLLGAAELNGDDYTPASWGALEVAVEGAWAFISEAVEGAEGAGGQAAPLAEAGAGAGTGAGTGAGAGGQAEAFADALAAALYAPLAEGAEAGTGVQAEALAEADAGAGAGTGGQADALAEPFAEASAEASGGALAPLAADIDPLIAEWERIVSEAIAALEPAEPAFGDAVSGGVFARGGAVELIAEETGGTAQAEFYFATKGASRVGTVNLRLSYRLADAEGAEFSLPEWLAGGEGAPAKAALLVTADDADPDDDVRPILPGYRTYSVTILANSGTTLDFGAGAELLGVKLALPPAAESKAVSLLLTHLDVAQREADGSIVLSDAGIDPAAASQAVRVYSRFDVDRSGAVTLADVEIVRDLLGSGKIGGEWATELLARCDLDGSGVIDIADLTLVLAKYESTVR